MRIYGEETLALYGECLSIYACKIPSLRSHVLMQGVYVN